MKAFVLFLLCLVICACGGGGGGGTSTLSPFVGTWQGTWASANGDTGTISMNVDAHGETGGAMFNNNTALDATLTGQIQESGGASFQVQYDGENPFALAGPLSLTNNDNDLDGTMDGNGTTFTLSLDRQ